MLGTVYIALCIFFGMVLCNIFFKNLKKPALDAGVPAFLVELPAWYLTGSLCVTWLVYIMACLFHEQEKPLLFANLLVLPVVFTASVLYFGFAYKNKRISCSLENVVKFAGVEEENRKKNVVLWLFVAAALSFVTYLMYLTFHVKEGAVCVGFSVFSDFAPHLGMIRSFSFGDNFPTQYAHYAGEDIRYHFMFQFMVGNLEFLGMRLDHAFNLPSIFGMVSVYLLLFVLAVRITKSRLCGYLTALLFTFRSSFTVFRYMAEQPKGYVLEALKYNTEFLGYTQNENWGLWNLNVYANQRHLAFSLAIMVLAVLIFYPYMEKMGAKLAKTEKKEDRLSYANEQLRLFFFTRSAFWVSDVKMAVGMGLVLGGIAFWNGSVLVATIAMLFFMAAVSDDRLDYLITAVLALVLALVQSACFVDGSAVAPAYYFGFLADNKTLWGVILFVVELTGVVLLVALAGAAALKGVKRYMFFVALVPFVLAFTLSLTVDITVNHKWIMMSLMFVSVFAACLLTRFLKSGDWLKRMVALVLVVVLTATGVYDFRTVVKRNENYLIFREDDPVTEWVRENATSEDIFLTPYYSLNNIVMGGAMLYYGWPYYAWSAGYDTDLRNYLVKIMYESETSEDLKELIEKNNIRYIVVDHDCRTSSEYDVREDVIENTYEVVFEYDTNDWMVRIFDTQKER